MVSVLRAFGEKENPIALIHSVDHAFRSLLGNPGRGQRKGHVHSCKALDALLKQQVALSQMTPTDLPNSRPLWGTGALSHISLRGSKRPNEPNGVCESLSFNLAPRTSRVCENEELPFQGYFEVKLKYYVKMPRTTLHIDPQPMSSLSLLSVSPRKGSHGKVTRHTPLTSTAGITTALRALVSTLRFSSIPGKAIPAVRKKRCLNYKISAFTFPGSRVNPPKASQYAV